MSDFCPNCGQVKHVGYDECVDCLDAEWYKDIDKEHERGNWGMGDKIGAFFVACFLTGMICGIGIAVFLYVISYGWSVI